MAVSFLRQVYCDNPRLPLVSVITPCYQYCKNYLPETMESVMQQTYGNIEHLVLHGNCDAPNQKPVIPSIARNMLIQQASGEFVLPLDADDKLVPHAVSSLVDHRSLAHIISCLQLEFGDVRHVHGSPTYTHLTFSGFYTQNRIHNTSLFRRSLWEELGGYDPKITWYEDWDFWLRCAKAGRTFFVVPQVLLLYRRHAGSQTTKVAASEEAMNEFRAKWPM